MAVQEIRVVLDADQVRNSARQASRDIGAMNRALGATQQEVDAVNDEFEEQLGLLQRLEREERDLRQARQRSQDPRQIQQYNRQIHETQRAQSRLTQETNRQGSSLKRLGALAAGAFAVDRITQAAAATVRAFDVQVKAEEKVAQAIKSTGGAARLSLRQLTAEAQNLQNDTLFGDEEILNNATAQLLTFTNIAGDNFKRAQAVALDLSTVLDGDLKSSSIQLGKALNDPVANLSALSRSGIQFTTEQKKVIKDLATTNRLAEAQGIILEELERQYGGQAQAAVTGAGALQQLGNVFGDIQEAVGGFLLNGLVPLAKELKDLIAPTRLESDLIREQQIETNVLTGILLDNTSAQKTKEEALRRLSEVQPGLVEGIRAEAVDTGLLTERISALNVQFEKRIRLALAQEKVNAIQKRLTETTQAAVDAEIAINKAFAERFGFQNSLTTGIEDQIKALEKLGNVNGLLGVQFEVVRVRNEQLTKGQQALTAATQNLTEVEADSVDILTQQTSTQTTATEATKKATKATSEKNKVKKQELDLFAKERELRGQLKGLREDLLLTKEGTEARANIQAQIESVNDLVDAYGEGAIQLREATVPDDALVRSGLDQFRQTAVETVEETTDTWGEQFQELFTTIAEDGRVTAAELREAFDALNIDPEMFANAALTAIDIVGKFQEQALQNQLSSLESEQAAALAAAGDNAQARAAIEAQFQEKKDALELQAAKRRKKRAIVEATIEGAIQVIKTLANPILASITAAAVAANIALIASQQFKKGGYVEGVGGYTGTGNVNQPAGIVHRGEFVLDAPTTAKLGLKGKSMDYFNKSFTPLMLKPEVKEAMMVKIGGSGESYGKLLGMKLDRLNRTMKTITVNHITVDENGYQHYLRRRGFGAGHGGGFFR